MKLSIIIPAYNAEKCISNCLDSIFVESPNEDLFEVMIINDGSDDNTSLVVREYSNLHTNVRLIEQNNGGVSKARNVGIDASNGEYVLFLDADDELVEGALLKLCDYLSHHGEMDMLVTRQIRKRGQKVRIVNIAPLEEHKSYNGVEAYQCHYTRTTAGGGICRKEFLDRHRLRFPEGVTNGEDSIFFVLVQVYAQSIVYYNLLLYRINEVVGSASRSNSTNVGLKLINTLNAASSIKSSLQVNKERRGVFDHVVYVILSNATNHFVNSDKLTYRQLVGSIKLSDLLPLETQYMYLHTYKAKLMNISYAIFYFSSWLKHLLKL